MILRLIHFLPRKLLPFVTVFSFFFGFSLLAQDKNPSEAPIPYPYAEELQQAEDAGSPFFYEFLHMLWVLALLVAGLILVAWLFKRFVNARLEQVNEQSAIKIVERRMMSPKTALYILEINGTEYIMIESASGVSLTPASSEKKSQV